MCRARRTATAAACGTRFATPAGPGGQTVAERLQLLDANLLEIRTLSSGAAEMFVTMDDGTRAQYLAKMKAEGELAALRWVAARK